MNLKENALKIIRFDNPERVTPRAPWFELFWRGAKMDGFDGTNWDSPAGTKWVDVFGTTWNKLHEGMIGHPVGFPLAEPKHLQNYQWINPDDERICGLIYEMYRDFPGGDMFLAGSHIATLWEKAYQLVGMENIMLYFFTEPDFVRDVLHHIMDIQLGIAEHYANLGVELVRLCDDLGAQNGPLLGPRIVDEFLVPEYRRLFKFYKERDMLIYFHCDGNLDSLLDVFLDLGVDILNPVQVTANNLDTVRARTQGRMALEGGVASATVMEGPVERIESEVRERLWQLGKDGGYFCRYDQGMPYPEAHVDALLNTVEKYGKYPLQPPWED
jgi:uroporphyrinogen decarboxylase